MFSFVIPKSFSTSLFHNPIMKKYIFLLLTFLFSSLFSVIFAQNSVLSEGKFYKLKISESGIHKITVAQLQEMGIDVAQINPSNIKIYGNTGGMLPQKNADFRYNDLIENAIFVEGQSDGKFDANDYILFYAEAADAWTYNHSKKSFEHSKNLYDDANYYFLTIGNDAGKRLVNAPNSVGNANPINTFNDFLAYQKDDFNILASISRAPGGSGRNWYGEYFKGQNSYDFEFDVDGILANSILKTTVSAIGISTSASNFEVAINNQKLGDISINSILGGTYDRKAFQNQNTFLASVSSSIANNPNLKVTISYNQPNSRAEGYLDFIVLNFERELKLYGEQTKFRSLKSLNNNFSQFNFSDLGSGNVQIWDITEALNAQNVVLNGNSFKAETLSLKEFIIFSPESDLLEVEFVEEIENQNLHGSQTPDFIIITAPDFEEEAQRLAEFRRSNDNLEVIVATTTQVYNEFSSGRQDVTAMRDLIRYFYFKSPDKLKYVLLFGDASYDYKNRVTKNSNFVPVYEARESFDPIRSYASDDYLVMMEENEGEWVETNARIQDDLDLGVGRLPVQSLEEAKLVVDKLLHYESQNSLGEWRNEVAFVADDGDYNIHLRDSETLGNTIGQNFNQYDVDKLYIDAFPQSVTPSGKRSPVVQNLLKEHIKQGVFLINFMGHGSETAWTSEDIFNNNIVNNLTNYDKLPLFVTATCEFGRFDNPNFQAGAELLVTNPKGGAIAALTTTRPVFSNTNFRLAKAFYKAIFEKKQGKYPRLGDIFKDTKNNSLDLVNRNFTLLGDPSMRLAYPEEEVKITKITSNGQIVTQLSALEKIQVDGEIHSDLGLDSDFNGTVQIKVHDKTTNLNTLGDESASTQYIGFKNVIFKGQAKVSNGKFSFEFVVPKDIVYPVALGKITLYAQHDTKVLDANGFKEILIGGSQNTVSFDNSPPQIQLFLGSTAFKSGDKVPSNTNLIAQLSDENGINITGVGIGHDIVAFIDGDEDNAWVLNTFYQSRINDFTRGDIDFALSQLPVGKHTLTLRAWDTYNNLGEETIDFVVQDAPIEITNLGTYPNPMQNETHINFEHNRIGQDLEVILRIYDTKGVLVKNLTQYYQNNDGKIDNIRWNGKDNSGNLVSQGMYIYRIFVRSLSDDAYVFAAGKVIVL